MKKYLSLISLSLLVVFVACTRQNPKYIGKDYGVFDIDQVSFNENLDTLFSRSPFFVITKKNSHFDTLQKKEIWTDTLLYTYRIPKAKVAGLYRFKNITVKDNVVSFTADKNKKFRKVDFSIYISTAEYDKLISLCKDFKDVTTEQVRKFNNNKYIILQKEEGQKQTTLYCLNNKTDIYNKDEGDYFIRINVNDLRIKNDRFYELENNDIKH
ncbi:hypothetical protein [Pedobacter sp. UBA5917]|uniref:hypothetical protein n=1 Tax=Pedobacter sp. UBA5917 TaxID=1947061 RepID=UPI0025ED6369|nr:hypothetical protein [Pedobacter sp. UBA5917]